jgi:hypothetical protein
MKFYSGFSLKNEQHFFQNFIFESDYTICGFSYGAILALKEVKKELDAGKRVDRLQLFSPAFFQTKPKKFKRLQLITFSKNRELYLESFIESCFLPYSTKTIEHSKSTLEELEELLNYEWSSLELRELVTQGVTIEVYLGDEDKIIDAKGAKEFFLEYSSVTYIKKANHFLQTN